MSGHQWPGTRACPRCRSLRTWAHEAFMICGSCGKQWKPSSRERRPVA